MSARPNYFQPVRTRDTDTRAIAAGVRDTTASERARILDSLSPDELRMLADLPGPPLPAHIRRRIALHALPPVQLHGPAREAAERLEAVRDEARSVASCWLPVASGEPVEPPVGEEDRERATRDHERRTTNQTHNLSTAPTAQRRAS
jgi:hypothetical protein